MATDDIVFGDVAISSSCATLDGVTQVPIYTFEPGSDGSYALQATVLAWQVGGGGASYFLEINWTRNAGSLAVDGTVFSSPTGSLAPGGLAVDVSGAEARVLVVGLNNQPLLWRLRGVRLDLTV